MKQRSFRNNLLGTFLIVGLLPLLLFLVLGIDRIFDRLKGNRANAETAVLISIESRLQEYIYDARSTVEHLSDKMNHMSGKRSQEIQDILDLTLDVNHLFSGFIVLDDQKKVLTLSPPDELAIGCDFSMYPFFDGKEDTPGFDVVVSEPFIPITTGNVTVSLMKKFGTGYFIGLLRLDDLSESLKLMRLSERDSIGVIDSHRRFIAHTEPANVYERGYERIDTIVAGNEPKILLDRNGTQIAYNVRSKKIMYPDWMVLYYHEGSDFESLYLDLSFRFFSAGLIAALLCFLFVLYLEKLLYRPLRQLVDGLGSMAHGQFNEFISVQEWKEFNTIIEVFNLMAEQLRFREEKIVSSLHEKEVLLKEIHHRVKNNLQVISSLLHLQSSKIKDQRDSELFEVSQDRVRSMALIHELIYQSENLAFIDMMLYLKKLVSMLSHSVRNSNASFVPIEFIINIDPIKLNLDDALPCGLIINELVTNSLKYAFSTKNRKQGENPRIHVEFVQQAEEIRILIADNGCGIPQGMDFEKVESVGFSIIRSLTKQLKGHLKIETIEGVSVTIVFPVRKE